MCIKNHPHNYTDKNCPFCARDKFKNQRDRLLRTVKHLFNVFEEHNIQELVDEITLDFEKSALIFNRNKMIKKN